MDARRFPHTPSTFCWQVGSLPGYFCVAEAEADHDCVISPEHAKIQQVQPSLLTHCNMERKEKLSPTPVTHSSSRIAALPHATHMHSTHLPTDKRHAHAHLLGLPHGVPSPILMSISQDCNQIAKERDTVCGFKIGLAGSCKVCHSCIVVLPLAALP